MACTHTSVRGGMYLGSVSFKAIFDSVKNKVGFMTDLSQKELFILKKSQLRSQLGKCSYAAAMISITVICRVMN